MHWLLLPVSLLCVLATAAIAQPAAEETPKATAPSTTKPDESKSKAQPSAAEIRKMSDQYFNTCMSDWDAGTHMTKKEWARTCRRIADDRAKFRSEEWPP
jgi:hypothetical protein